MTTLHDFTVNTIDGAPKKLSDVWNSEKFVVDKKGNVRSRFAPPMDAEVTTAIEHALG